MLKTNNFTLFPAKQSRLLCYLFVYLYYTRRGRKSGIFCSIKSGSGAPRLAAPEPLLIILMLLEFFPV